MAKLGLVTVFYKSDDVLEDFFKSLSLQTYKDYHLYIIDNSPSDGTDELITQLASQFPIPGYTHIKNAENYGVAKGNNLGIKLALQNNSDFIILLNNDIDFHQTFLLERIVKCAINKNEDIIVPKMLFYGTRKIWIAGGKFIMYKGVSKAIGMHHDDCDRYNNAGHFNYAPTCFMLINRKVFDDLGFMDESYFVYFDDDDFVLRAIKKGYKIYFLPTLEIFHKVSFITGGSESLFSIYYLNRNRIYFIRKNFSFPMKYIALTHAVITKSVRYLMYNKNSRKQLLKGFRDGFRMQLS